MSSATGLHKIVPEQGFIGRSFLHDEEARPILEAKKYRQYAKDCVRIAASMSGKDRQTLLDIADAWEARAVEAESKRPKSDGGRDPGGPGVVPDAGS
jgi:hypothetical protein